MEKQKFEYFIKRTDESLGLINQKLDDLYAFRWKSAGLLLGASGVVSIIVSALVTIATIYFGPH